MTDWRTLDWRALRYCRGGIGLVSSVVMFVVFSTVVSAVPLVPTLVVHAVRAQFLWRAQYGVVGGGMVDGVGLGTKVDTLDGRRLVVKVL